VSLNTLFIRYSVIFSKFLISPYEISYLFGNLHSLISFRGVDPATKNLICFISAAFGLVCTHLNYTPVINLGTVLRRLYSVMLNDCISTPFIVL
jgi:hypothetical protein